jgi:hypothetical protein
MKFILSTLSHDYYFYFQYAVSVYLSFILFLFYCLLLTLTDLSSRPFRYSFLLLAKYYSTLSWCPNDPNYCLMQLMILSFSLELLSWQLYLISLYCYILLVPFIMTYYLQWRPKVRSPPLPKKCFWSNFSSFKYLLLKFSLKMCLVILCHLLKFGNSKARVWHVRSKRAGNGGERTFGHNFVFSLKRQFNDQIKSSSKYVAWKILKIYCV